MRDELWGKGRLDKRKSPKRYTGKDGDQTNKENKIMEGEKQT